MKIYQNSFLFFYVCIAGFILNPSYLLQAQEAKVVDSLTYYRTLALRPKTNLDRTKSYVFFKKRSEQSLKNNDTLNIIYDLRFIAIIQLKFGLLQESETTAVSALSFVDNLNEDDAITYEPRVGLNNHLGLVYRDLSDYPSALKYFDAALKLKPDSQNISSIHNNMGLIYFEQANYQKALELFTKVHHTNLNSNDTSKIARSLSNIGKTMSKMHRPAALDSLTKALQLRKSIKNSYGIIGSYLKLAEYYQDRGDIIRANSYANKADQLAKLHGDSSQEVEALSKMMQLNPDTNVQRYTQLIDRINASKLSIQNRYAAKKYGLEKQERLIKENELKLKTSALDSEQQKGKTISALFLAILILLSSIFVFIYLRFKHKKEKLQGIYDTESRISKKIHDEVANDVFQLMTKLEHEDQIDTDVIDELHSLYYRIRDISKEHGALNDSYPFVDHLSALIESFHDSQTTVVIKGLSEISWTVFPEIQRVTVYKVIQELLINMKKHSQAIIVVLVFQQDKRKLSISYSDNGVGTHLKKGNGLQNTENRIQAINGSITFETNPNKGFKAKINI